MKDAIDHFMRGRSINERAKQLGIQNATLRKIYNKIKKLEV